MSPGGLTLLKTLLNPFLFTDDYYGYEQEEDGDFEEEEENFDVSHFIDPEEWEGRDDDGFANAEAHASGKVEEDEMDPEELEKTLKRLEEVFCCLPRVLIKRILCQDDVKGNIKIASQRLQEFQNMDDPQDMFKAPMPSKPHVNQPPPENRGDLGVEQGKAEAEPQRFQGKKKRRRRRKNKNKKNENGPQVEQMEEEEQQQWRRNSFDQNVAEQRGENHFYCDQESRRGRSSIGKPRGGSRGGARGGLRGETRSGFGQGQRYDQDDWRFGYEDSDFMRQRQTVRRNVNDRGRPPDPRPMPRGTPQRAMGERTQRMPRGGLVPYQEEYGYDLYQDTGDNGQEYGDDVFQDDWRFRYEGGNFMPQRQRVRGHVNDRGRLPDPRPIPRRTPQRATGEGQQERPRGGLVAYQGEYGCNPYQQAWDNADLAYRGGVIDFQEGDGFKNRREWDQNTWPSEFAQGRREREQPSHGRGRGRRGPRGQNKDTLYLLDLENNSETDISYYDVDLGHYEDVSNDRDEENSGRHGRPGNRARSCEGMARAQNMFSVAGDQDADMIESEADESRFEQYKLVVCGLSEMTTDEGLFNFIEAMSGTEVKEVSRLGKTKAIVTMADRIKGTYLRLMSL